MQPKYINLLGGALILQAAAIIKIIGELIQDTRCASIIIITSFSKLSDINKSTISRIVSSEIKRPEFSTLEPLATALDITYKILA
ncbi:helix-turn-helix domain-containing protein [Paenibacillus sp. chi10]|uniref:Helix-turn-helix domain-containing protein n=1 Tax=Paenibacillus suaedae TaxID=3077233 RepID=A0AAJ2JVY8_9BACL|nr:MULTISPECIES: helix-turn-helix domain-containing protein [unclassified Paenibacillus]MDT8975174.1 helix-turn-helix domain-containing protein [Paenibacillus sp. chi10]GAV10193.1 putative DNA-binding protein [Paenibacillus sp. NAIST15-1]